jgi:hypothetical protein
MLNWKRIIRVGVGSVLAEEVNKVFSEEVTFKLRLRSNELVPTRPGREHCEPIGCKRLGCSLHSPV